MPICERLSQFLAGEFAAYQVISHRPVFGAQRVAATTQLPGRDVAKVLVVQDARGEPMMVVIPSQARLDLDEVARATGRHGLRLAKEREFAPLFPDCEVGAMPPFGNLYGMPTYMDACFRDEPAIFFSGGTHRELVGMRVEDYEAVAHPVVGRWCFHRRLKAA
jgi:Ala-tRNA(Pro) deacylase